MWQRGKCAASPPAGLGAVRPEETGPVPLPWACSPALLSERAEGAVPGVTLSQLLATCIYRQTCASEEAAPPRTRN